MSLTTLDALYDAYAKHTTIHGEVIPIEDRLRITAHGRFVRKRRLSKGLIFGDLALTDNQLVEVMIRAQEGLLTIDQIRQVNWNVHLGDLVTINGFLDKKCDSSADGVDHLLLTLLTVEVNELWSVAHPDMLFDHMRYGTIITHHHTNVDAKSTPTNVLAPCGSHTLPPHSQADAPRKYTNIVQIDGFNTCKYYFAGANGKNCLRGASCHFWHGDANDYEVNRQKWLAKRHEQRLVMSQIDGDGHDPEEKGVKSQRAIVFCEWLIEHTRGIDFLGAGSGVIDVAGGKGEIPIQLWTMRGIPTTLIDPRPMKLSKKNRKLVENGERGICQQLQCLLTYETAIEHATLFANCSMFVGMHPDEATEMIVDIALQMRKPFAVVPCCVMSRVFPHRKCRDGTPVSTYETFITYLMEKDSRIQRTFLSFTGRNQLIYLLEL